METAIDGFQGPPGHLSNPDRVLATAKHFAGDGLTTYGTGSNMHTTGTYPIDQGVDQVDHATFDRLALSPYVSAVREHHVGSVMPSYSDVDWTEDGLGNRINMHANRDLITGWLKDAMGFNGFVISDYNGIDHINPETYTFAQKVAAGVNAGIDMFMQPQNFELFDATLTDLVNSGQVSIARINDAVSRILTKKFELGCSNIRSRTAATSTRSARRPTTRWPAGRPPSPRCCSRTAGTCCRSKAAATSTSPARTPTTSATRPAAGR